MKTVLHGPRYTDMRILSETPNALKDKKKVHGNDSIPQTVYQTTNQPQESMILETDNFSLYKTSTGIALHRTNAPVRPMF